MLKMLLVALITLSSTITTVQARTDRQFENDTIATANGNLVITFIGHASLMFAYDGKIIHIDPVGSEADYGKLPKADLILVTHEHKDHFDPAAIQQLRKEKTVIIANSAAAKDVQGSRTMKNGDVKSVEGIAIEAVPAYNIVNMRSKGVPYHPKGNGNGYVLTFGDTRVYVAGDTENIPEMKQLQNINIAFLPMNLPYTMTPQMVADAAQSFMPEILYPYHYGDTDTLEIMDILKNTEIEVRIRSMR